MLSGAVPPQRIQCLTFTKAAAAEMAVRLQNTLGDMGHADRRRPSTPNWPSCDLAASDALRQKARALFAEVLDLPGGMRIGTIHAFCQSLLRRFPLEAALSPHFRLMDDPDAADAMTEAREDMLAGATSETMQHALALLAGLASAEQFGRHVVALQADRKRLHDALALGPGPDRGAAPRAGRHRVERRGDPRQRGELAGGTPPAPRRRRSCGRTARPSVAAAGGTHPAAGSASTPKPASRSGTTGARNSTPKPANAARRRRVRQRQPGQGAARPCPTHSWPKPRASPRSRTAAARCRSPRCPHALVTLAAPMLRGLRRAQGQRRPARLRRPDRPRIGLLVDPGAAWVLYKLDGGIDHLLLDEVQDTAPAQWRIAHALTEEFFAGAGRARTRTARCSRSATASSRSTRSRAPTPTSSTARAKRLRRRVDGGRPGIGARSPLDVSFRSTAPVLALVDAVFADPLAAAGVDGARRRCATTPIAPGTPARSSCGRSRRGRTNRSRRTVDRAGAQPGPAHRAAASGRTPGRLDRATRPAAPCGWRARAASSAPGDVMVLVRRRNDFARALVRALKSRGVAGRRARSPGADRAARGAGPDGAVRCAAAAAGRSDASPAC